MKALILASMSALLLLLSWLLLEEFDPSSVVVVVVERPSSTSSLRELCLLLLSCVASAACGLFSSGSILQADWLRLYLRATTAILCARIRLQLCRLFRFVSPSFLVVAAVCVQVCARVCARVCCDRDPREMLLAKSPQADWQAKDLQSKPKRSL